MCLATGSRWSRVVAAKTRSRRTSNASLRVTARSRSRAGRGSDDQRERPPVPDLPDSFLDLGMAMSRQGPSYLEDAGKEASILVPVQKLTNHLDSLTKHPFSSAGTAPPAKSIPSIWLSADSSPKAEKSDEPRDRVQSLKPPLLRHDSARRSVSEYTSLHTRKASRFSVPVSVSTMPVGTTRSGTP